MLRGWLIVIFLFGMFGSMMTSCLSRQRVSSFEPQSAGRFGPLMVKEGDASPAADAPSPLADGAIELPRSSDGHFYADVTINGASVHAMVDTGASGIALSREDARKAGVATSIGMPNVVGQGASGDVRGEFVTLQQITLGSKRAEGMDAIVLDSGSQTLLGQEFLAKFASVEIKGDTMVLR